MPERYHVFDEHDIPSTLDSATLAKVHAKDGQLLLAILDLVENAHAAIDDLIDVMGRATTEAVLLMSAAHIAGPKQEGKKADRGWPGPSPGPPQADKRPFENERHRAAFRM